MAKYTEDTAKATVKRNGHMVGSKSVKLTHWPGIRVWGAIDFLVKHCKYSLTRL